MTEYRRQRSEERGQETDDKGKKVRGWEGVKVRKNPQSELVLPLTFSL